MPRWPYGTKQWRYARLEKLSAAPVCEMCGALADQVDHIKPIEVGGAPFDQGNLQSLCQKCHSAKTAAEDHGFGNKRGKYRMRGCKPDGTPLDPRHEWNTPSLLENLPEAAGKNRVRKQEES